MSVSLISVFIPILLMGGIVGRLFREFAVTLSIAILHLPGRLLDDDADDVRAAAARPLETSANAFFRTSERAFGRWRRLTRARSAGPRASALVALTLLAIVGLNIYLFVIVPKGFFPQQDTGRMVGGIRADQNISFEAMREKLARYVAIIKADPAIDSVVGFTGGWPDQHRRSCSSR